jgi:hypothetical protein
MNEEHHKKTLYTKILIKEDGSREKVEMTQEEIVKYHEDLAEIKRKSSLPEYKFCEVIAHPDKTFEIIKKTPEEIENMNQQLQIQLQMQFLPNLREIRDNLLKQSDVLVLPDRWITYSEDKKTKISNYRQALRDLPDNVVYIEDKDIYSYMPDKPY